MRAVSTSPIVLVDISPDCCRELYRLTEGDAAAELFTGDFLEMGTDRLGTFDSIIMNPPFKMGTDIRHVRHAAAMLRPAGRLVSLVANGPRQREKLMPIATEWIDLPAGSFASEGTGVNAAMVVIDNTAR
jgi:16S rRNA G1207 methylase RsmC